MGLTLSSVVSEAGVVLRAVSFALIESPASSVVLVGSTRFVSLAQN